MPPAARVEHDAPQMALPSTPSFPQAAAKGAPAAGNVAASPHTPVIRPEGAPAEAPRVLHIPCPNGHELETPPDMIGQEVLCPECGAQFRLRERDSREHKERREREQARREQQASKAWLHWAIIFAVIVAGFVVFLIISSAAK